MNRDELGEMLATEPATANQACALHREFARLGSGAADRAGRLAVTAALLDLGEISSTPDLTMADAKPLGMRRPERMPA